MSRWWWPLFVMACSAPQVAPPSPQTERLAWQQRLATLDPTAPLALRYNPADCNCPAFELAVGERWLRAEVVPDEALQPWLGWLAGQPPEAWPVAVQAAGRVNRTLLRTESGLYAVRIDRLQVLSPLGPLAPPAAAIPPPGRPAESPPGP
jgi:hypothetical protein